jgi:UDP-N-acetylmuramoyl-L-alanyl-D-glutamate--2,6-diaminopimelate ligase
MSAVAGFDVAALLSRLALMPRRITADSRLVRAGDAFAAFPGQQTDGRAFIPDAIARGAGAVLWEALAFRWDAAWRVSNIAVEDLKSKLGAIADHIYGHPSRDLYVVGVTGTNGKTSCSHWIAQCFAACGRKSGIIGTLGSGVLDTLAGHEGGALDPSPRTTPDAASVHETLARMRSEGARAVAMEVSSHGLDQGRVNGVEFDVALFTNLTRDHLDYHRTMTEYGAVKARLFAWPTLEACVINHDDAFGRTLASEARSRGQKVLTYGMTGGDIVAIRVESTREGMELTVSTPWGRADLTLRLSGTFNASNVLGVLGVLLSSGIGFSDALASLQRVTPPAGRMQRIGGGTQPLVVVDYAHTPDALEKVLDALRPAVTQGHELICVFGCGGDRDPGKRADMGRIAAARSDRIVVTSDNPRREDPAAIAAAVVAGIHAAGGRNFVVELDRGAAIRGAVASARAGDVVLVAGKGHEDYQERNGVRTPFSDAGLAEVALAQKGGA